MYRVNVELLHERWLGEMASYATDYLGKRHGYKTSTAAVMTMVATDEFAFETLGTFNLPAGAGRLMLHMARFCRCTFGRPERIIGLPVVLDELPEPTFCLTSLLMASFPKNTETGYFKAHDCAMAVGDLGDPESAFRSGHIAFAGLGVMIMNASRKILSPIAPDSEVIKLGNEKYLSIIETLPKDE